MRDCERLLELGLTGQFPARDHREHARAVIVSFFHHLVHTSFASIIAKHYGHAPDWERGYALGILSRQPDEESFETMAKLLDQFGVPIAPFPDRTLADRHLGNIRRRMPNLLLTTRNADQLAAVMNLINVALQQGHLALDDLAPASAMVQTEGKRLLDELEEFLNVHGSDVRDEEAYEDLRVALGVYIDLLGILPGTSSELLERAQRSGDPQLILLAVVSLLRKGIEPSSEALARCISSHAVRQDLYAQLKNLSRLDLFPSRYLNLESFAACEMVRWLMFPSELGYEPDALELVAKLAGKSEDGGDAVMFLWKCTAGEGAFACANGPFRTHSEMGELLGGHSFSNFTAWDEATPEEHLAEIVGTLSDWCVSWCDSANPQ